MITLQFLPDGDGIHHNPLLRASWDYSVINHIDEEDFGPMPISRALLLFLAPGDVEETPESLHARRNRFLQMGEGWNRGIAYPEMSQFPTTGRGECMIEFWSAPESGRAAYLDLRRSLERLQIPHTARKDDD